MLTKIWTLIAILSSTSAGGGCGDDSGGDSDADSDSDSDSDVDPCLGGDPAADEIVPEEIATGFPGAATEVATDWTTAVVCGADGAAGFAQAVDLGSGEVGAEVALPAPCTGVSVEGSWAVTVDAGGRLFLFEIGAGASLGESADDENLAAVYRGVLLAGGVAHVAAGSFGVLRFDAGGGTLSALGAWTTAEDARDLVPDGDGFALADGEAGAKLLDMDGEVVATLDLPDLSQNVDKEGGLTEITLPYEAETIAVSDAWMVVGSQAYGYEFATRDGTTLGAPQLNGRPNFHEGPVFDVAMQGEGLVYAEGGSIRRMGLAGGTLVRLASEYRAEPSTLGGGWWVGVEARGGETLLLATDALYRATLGDHVQAPDIDLERQSLYALVPAGDDGPTSLTLRNYGDAELAIRLQSISPDAYTARYMDLAGIDPPDADDPSCLRLQPGGNGGALEVHFTAATDDPVEGEVTMLMNDPDEGDVTLPIQGNPDPLDVGEAAPDFALTALDGEVFRMSDHLGDVVLLMFFNST